MDLETCQEAVTQNLIDAGCEAPLIGAFWRLLRGGKQAEAMALLAGHRRRLLERCHAEQRKIDCLDYLLYQMERGIIPSAAPQAWTSFNR